MTRVRDRSYPPDLYGGGAPPVAPSITAVAPPSVVAGSASATFTVTGAGIAAPVDVFYAGSGPSGQVPATSITATSFQFTLPGAAIAVAGSVTWNADIGPDIVTVDGPNIAVTAAAGTTGTTGGEPCDDVDEAPPARTAPAKKASRR